MKIKEEIIKEYEEWDNAPIEVILADIEITEEDL